MIIAVDYDGTLYNDGQVNVALIQSLRKDGKPHRSAYWKDEKLIEDLKSIL